MSQPKPARSVRPSSVPEPGHSSAAPVAKRYLVQTAPPETLAEAARRYAQEQDAGTKRDWVGQVYPIVRQAMERRCAREKEGKLDDVLGAFVEKRLEEVGLAKLVACAQHPESYLRQVALNFVNARERQAAPMLLLQAGPDDPRFKEPAAESEDMADNDGSRRRTEQVRAVLASWPARDRVIFVASYLGVAALAAEDRAWIADRRGVPLALVESEMAQEEARCEALREAARAELEKAEQALGKLKLRTHRAWVSYETFPNAKMQGEVQRLSAAVQSKSQRCDKLQALLADPFCGPSNRRQIAHLIGECPAGTDPDTAANSTWKRARRLHLSLLKKM